MTNLEKKIMASRGYVHPFDRTMNFASWVHKPTEPPPEGYEYEQYITKYGNKRWKLKRIDNDKLITAHAPEALKGLFGAGTQPGTTSKLLGDTAGTVIDMVTGNA